MQAQQTRRAVVVGVDGSQSALTAVRWAAREASRRRLPLRLVHAFSWPNTRHIGDPGLGFATTKRCFCGPPTSRFPRRPTRLLPRPSVSSSSSR
ncbi:MAG TPA: universal stress protein [Pseudonocardiaceae bacterium]|nr:universal stress protein [Pseudonocardiaceae bacterium]